MLSVWAEMARCSPTKVAGKLSAFHFKINQSLLMGTIRWTAPVTFSFIFYLSRTSSPNFFLILYFLISLLTCLIPQPELFYHHILEYRVNFIDPTFLILILTSSAKHFFGVLNAFLTFMKFRFFIFKINMPANYYYSKV